MAIQSLLSFVNGVCSTVSNGFTTFLTVNYYVGQSIVTLVTACLVQLKALIITLSIATYILLEDLSVFILETFESICTGAEIVTGAIDAMIYGVLTTVAYVKAGIGSCLSCIGQFADTVVSTVTSALNSLEQFWRLLGSSLLMMVSIIPKTIGYVYNSTVSNIVWTFDVISQRTTNAWNSVQAAPFESLLGLAATVLIALSSQKLIRHLVVSRNLTWGWLAQLTLKLVCFVYLQFCLFLIALGTGIARSVEFTLTHLHVPRFHHAGDVSDDEDEDVSVHENADSDDEPLSIRRRNYDLLLKKRDEKKRSKKLTAGQSTSKANKGSPDMEELLFEQVEREREDKLCVVCQDKEKCIMILPCRHLCICQDCLPPLLRSRNGIPICPICRKLIRQTIKVYL